MPRPSYSEYFMKIAEVVSSRSTCDRANVGCVLVRNKRIIATGYNGAPPDLPHCDEVGHELVNDHCIRTLHAEENAIIQCSVYGISSYGAACFITHHPCYACCKRLVSAGIYSVTYLHEYQSLSSDDISRIDVLRRLSGLHLIKLGARHGVV